MLTYCFIFSVGFAQNSQTNITDATCFCCNGLYKLTTPVITGADSICSEKQTIFSVANCSGATFIWTIAPSAITFSGQGTNSISVNYNSIPFGTSTILISVQLSCGKQSLKTERKIKICSRKLVIREGQDAMLHSLLTQQNTNMGTSVSNLVSSWKFNGTPANVFSIIKFNIPANITSVSQAYITFTENIAPNNGGHTVQYGSANQPTNFVIRALKAPWNESTVTWANYNPYTNSFATPQVVIPAYTSGADNITTSNLAPVINQMLANGNHGLIIMWDIPASNPTNYYRSRWFGSFNSSTPPVLTIQ